jgi:hypothetical protein
MESQILSRGLLLREIESSKVEGRRISDQTEPWMPVEIGEPLDANRISIPASEFATRHGRAKWNSDGTAVLFIDLNTVYEVRFLPRARSTSIACA